MKGQHKGDGKHEKGYHSWSYNDNRGEKRTLPWNREHYEHKKGKKGSGHHDKNDVSHERGTPNMEDQRSHKTCSFRYCSTALR